MGTEAAFNRFSIKATATEAGIRFETEPESHPTPNLIVVTVEGDHRCKG